MGLEEIIVKVNFVDEGAKIKLEMEEIITGKEFVFEGEVVEKNKYSDKVELVTDKVPGWSTHSFILYATKAEEAVTEETGFLKNDAECYAIPERESRLEVTEIEYLSDH